MDIKMTHMPNRGRREHHNDLWRKVGKLSLPYSDRSSKTSARAWVQKVDT
jgi:hypothetical protein